MANIRAADIETRLARHPEIPENVATILRRAISADLGTRYETAGQMADDLTAAMFDHGQHVSGGAVGRFLQEMMATYASNSPEG